MNAIAVLATLLPIIAGIVIAIKRSRPVLLFACVTLLAYFVVFPIIMSVPAKFDVAPWVVRKAQWLCALCAMEIVCIGLIAFRKNTRAADKWLQTCRADYKAESKADRKVQVICLTASCAGIAAELVNRWLRGGFLTVWDRKGEAPAAFAGLLAIVSFCSMLYPVAVYESKKRLGYVRPCAASLAFAIAVINVALIVVSGTTTRGVTLLIPLGVLFVYTHRHRRISVWRVMAVVIGGFILVATFRFGRAMGDVSHGGQQGANVRQAWVRYEEKNLNVWQSFGEFYVLCNIIEWVDRTGRTMGGRSYYLGPIGFVPGVMLPGNIKSELVRDSRPDEFVSNEIFGCVALLPSGFYGEAYLNFREIGLILVSAIFGWVVGCGDKLSYRLRVLGFPSMLIVSLLAASVCRASRMYLWPAATYLLGQIAILQLLRLALWRVTERGGRVRNQ